VRAMPDRCPHRGAALSLGRVVGGQLQCAYHGWCFDGGGACRRVPALPDFVPPAGHAVASFSCVEAHGLIWVCLRGEGTAALPAWTPPTDEEMRHVLCGPYTVATSAPRVVENFLDVAHFGYVHDGWLGDGAHTAVPDYRVVATSGGFELQGVRAWQPRSNLAAEGGSWVDYRYELLAPYSAALHKLPQAQAGYRDAIALFTCPREPEETLVWFALAMSDTGATDDEMRAFQHTIFTQDQPVLESQRPRRLPLSGGELHCAADRASAAYRRHLAALNVTFGVC